MLTSVVPYARKDLSLETFFTSIVLRQRAPAGGAERLFGIDGHRDRHRVATCIKYDGIGSTPAPVATPRPGVATRNTPQDQTSHDEALAQWQIESTRLYDFAVAAVCFDGLYQETDLNMMHSYEDAPKFEGPPPTVPDGR